MTLITKKSWNQQMVLNFQIKINQRKVFKPKLKQLFMFFHLLWDSVGLTFGICGRQEPKCMHSCAPKTVYALPKHTRTYKFYKLDIPTVACRTQTYTSFKPSEGQGFQPQSFRHDYLSISCLIAIKVQNKAKICRNTFFHFKIYKNTVLHLIKEKSGADILKWTTASEMW